MIKASFLDLKLHLSEISSLRMFKDFIFIGEIVAIILTANIDCSSRSIKLLLQHLSINHT